MGGSRWSEDHYKTQVRSSVASVGTAFVHTSKVASGAVAAAVHADLDPRRLKNGVRESRDSDAHPESNAILVGLDVTGSMHRCVKAIHRSLPKLMGLLTRKNYIAHPQICFCAIGDANKRDEAPLQVGQFESGAEMETDLSKFWLEGGGGGGGDETYELFAYFAARHTSVDCVEKRGKLGYCFIIGDEHPYPMLRASTIREWLPADEASDIDTKAIFRELMEQYNVFVILPTDSSHGDRYRGAWEEYVGAERVLALADSSAAAELIAAQIGMCESTADMDRIRKDLTDAGTSAALVRVVEDSVSTVAPGNRAGIATTGAFEGSGGGNIGRL